MSAADVDAHKRSDSRRAGRDTAGSGQRHVRRQARTGGKEDSKKKKEKQKEAKSQSTVLTARRHVRPDE